MIFISIWLSCIVFVIKITNTNSADCAAYFHYDIWLPLGFCLNDYVLMDTTLERRSSKFLCTSDKANLTKIYYKNFDCNEADLWFTTEDYQVISAMPSDQTVICQQDASVCTESQVAVVNSFRGVTQAQCDSSDFSAAPQFEQDSTIALDVCSDYAIDDTYHPGDSRKWVCNGTDVIQEMYLGSGCSSSLDSSSNALYYDTCTDIAGSVRLDVVVQCGTTVNTAITWSLDDYPLNPIETTADPGTTYDWRDYNYTDEDTYDSSASVAGLFAFLTFMCCFCSAFGVCMITMCCVLRCLRNSEDADDESGAVYKITMCFYYVFWLFLFLPLKVMAFGCAKIFFCRGCSMDIAKKFFSFLPNMFSTIIILSRFGKAESGIDFEKAAADGVAYLVKVDAKVVQGFAIIIFVLIGFVIKAKELYISHQVAKDKESAIVKSFQIKNLQALIITSSDTLFKIFSGIAIIVGSDYSGTDSEGMQSQVTSYIKGAAVIGMLVEFIDMLDEYLTKIFMFIPKQEVSTESGFSCTFSAETVQGELSGQLNVDQLEPGEPAQSVQKTILWNALWAGLKLFMLLLEQIFAFIAAVILAGSGDVIGFLVIVIICCFGDILLAGIMCTKYQRLSVGLFCKYYFCCLYDQCNLHCEKHWIKLDPVEKGLQFDAFGGVMTQKTKPKAADTAEKMQQQQELNTAAGTENAVSTENDNVDKKDKNDGEKVDIIISEKNGDENKVDDENNGDANKVDENKVDENISENNGDEIENKVDENNDDVNDGSPDVDNKEEAENTDDNKDDNEDVINANDNEKAAGNNDKGDENNIAGD